MTRRLPLLLVLPLLACQTLSSLEDSEPEYSDEAAVNMQKGADALESNDFVEAQRYFEFVRGRFPYSEHATLAELRLADVQFAQDLHAEARDAYETFVKIHPTHPEADYAALRAARTWWEEAPDELFILPPAYEKDMVSVRNAVKALSDFLRQYPESKHRAEGQKLLDVARTRLAKHELYVAEFYAKRKKWPAVVARLKTLVERYPGLGFDEEALFKLHAAYVALKDTQGAQDALKQIITRLPNTPAAARAQKLLGS